MFEIAEKRFLIIFLLLLTCKISYSQQAETTYLVHEDSLNVKNQKNGNYEKALPKKKPSISGLRFSLGGGIATPGGTEDISAFITANANFRIYKPVFLTVGYDVFETKRSKYANVLYVAPNLNANLLKDIFSFFGGIGFYVVAPKEEGIYSPGILFFTRVEYNTSKLFSIGTEIKHVKFLGDGFSNYPFYLFNLYFSIKL